MRSGRTASPSAFVESLEGRIQFDGGVTIIVGGASQSAFVKPVAYASGGKGPQGVVTGDFNRDRKPDIAYVNYGSNSLGIMLNTGSGNFGKAAVYANVGSALTSIAATDFNGDGYLDLAFVGRDLGVMFGKGNGTFNPVTHIALGKKPLTVITGDFNNDGRADIAATNFSSNTISVVLNRGRSRFFAPINSSGGNGPAGLAAGDFTGDGKLDIAVSDMGDGGTGGGAGARVLVGAGNGSFTATGLLKVGSRPGSIAAGDLNKDGKLDLVTSNGGIVGISSGGQDSVSVLMGVGSGTFGAATSFATGTGPTSVVIADYNRDKRLDVLVTNYGSSTISVLKGNNSGNLSVVESLPGATGNSSLAIADFNVDGKIDLVSTGFTAGTVVVYRQK